MKTETRRVFKKDRATLYVISRGHEDTKHWISSLFVHKIIAFLFAARRPRVHIDLAFH